MAEPSEHLRARDLLRRGDVIVRPWPGERTIRRLVYRQARRPAGNSAKLWKKVGAVDPYALPPDFPKSEHRAVYASGRFVRLDQADKPAPSPGKGVPKAGAAKAPPPRADAPPNKPAAAKAAGDRSERSADPKAWADDAKAQGNEKFRALADRIQQQAASKAKAKGTDELTPSQTRPAPAPKLTKAMPKSKMVETRGLDRPVHGAARNAPPISSAKGAQDLDRKPVIIKHTPTLSPAGRMRQAAARRAEGEVADVAAPEATAPAPAPVTPAAPARPAAPPAFANDPPPPPPAPKPPAPPIDAPPALASTAAKPAAATAGKELRVGDEIAIPKLDLPKGALNQLGAAQVVPRRKATKVEEVAETAPAAKSEKAAPVPRAPPLPGAGGGMDDLFGGAVQEGRVRVGRAKPTKAEG